MNKKQIRKEKQNQAYLKYYYSEKGQKKIKTYRNSSKVKKRQKKYHEKYRKTKKYKKGMRAYRDKIKRLVYEHYSPNGIKCKKCSFDDIRALSIDHIKGKGHLHRLKVGFGNALYRWIVRNNYPKGFQILCMNCQFIKRYENKEIPEREV